MALSTLLEDALLEVLSHLTPSELLLCRMVCKRWSELALHPWLWANKYVSFTCECEHVTKCSNISFCCSTSMRVIAAILQLVPCLRRLDISFYESHAAKDVVGLLSSTSCAVSHLSIDSSASHTTLIAATLARQASLGRLKEVQLDFWDAEESNRGDLCGLVLQLVQMHGLETLELHYYSNGTVLPALLGADQVDGLPSASLRKLVYFNGLSDLDPYLHLLLMRHAATLEDVEIGPEGPQVAPLLSTMANLRYLECGPLEGMSALLQCPSLKYLHLHVPTEPDPFLHAMKDYLRAAVALLEELVMEYCQFDDASDYAADLMLCLAGSGSAFPALREFHFWNQSSSVRHQRHLASVLRRLPNLRELDVSAALTGDFLAALDGTVLPNLVLLSHRCPAAFECVHEWAHSEEVERLLRKYPRLHIKAIARATTENGQCDFCEEHKCHAIPHGAFCYCLISCHEPKNCTEPFCCDDYFWQKIWRVHIRLESSDAYSRPTAPEPSE